MCDNNLDFTGQEWFSDGHTLETVKTFEICTATISNATNLQGHIKVKLTFPTESSCDWTFLPVDVSEILARTMSDNAGKLNGKIVTAYICNGHFQCISLK